MLNLAILKISEFKISSLYYFNTFTILQSWSFEDGYPEIVKNPVAKISQIMDIDSISSINKQHEMEFCKLYKLFNFQVRESTAALNITTPTPASDRGGPIACLFGIVWGVCSLWGRPGGDRIPKPSNERKIIGKHGEHEKSL